MDTQKLDSQRIAEIAERLGTHEFQGWFYGDSIGFEGLLAASKLSNQSKWMDFAHGFFRAWATRIEPFLPDDNTAPGHVMCQIVEQTEDQVLKSAVLKLGQHLRHRRKVNGVSITFEDTLRSLIPPYGGLELSPEEQKQMHDPGPGIYLDCMHFDPPFYAHLSRLDPEGGWAQAAVNEILGYKDLLFNHDIGLYRHFWLEKVNRAYTDGWGRGQGWALLGLLDVLAYAEKVEKAELVLNEAQTLAETMLHYQNSDGNWYSLVHDARSGPESSTAAFMATAFYRGMSQGILSPDKFLKPAEKAYQAMVQNLDDAGNLLGVSAAVFSALIEAHYWHVPLNQIVPWGQGPVLTALAARQSFSTSFIRTSESKPHHQ